MHKYKKIIAVKEEDWQGYIQEERENLKVISHLLADRLLG